MLQPKAPKKVGLKIEILLCRNGSRRHHFKRSSKIIAFTCVQRHFGNGVLREILPTHDEAGKFKIPPTVSRPACPPTGEGREEMREQRQMVHSKYLQRYGGHAGVWFDSKWIEWFKTSAMPVIDIDKSSFSWRCFVDNDRSLCLSKVHFLNWY